MIARRFLVLVGLLFVTPLSGAPPRQDGTIADSDIKVVELQEIKYPGIAAMTPGVVVVRVALDDHGGVTDAVALSGGPILIRHTIEAVKAWRFEPNPEKAAILVFNFRVEGLCTFGGWSSQMIFYPPNFAAITACGHPPVP